ncbi:MAG: hypothetical protein HYY01_15755 [Chloroflexi bacterium]|nr:hypothetical protein [Chloroflexota bacterium]
MNIRRLARRELLLYGIVGGIAAGLVFAVAEMFMNLALGEAFLGPVRMISSIVLGTGAIEPGYSLPTALVVGLGVHMALSALYGIIFAGGLALVRRITSPATYLVPYGAVFGLALWIVNFLLIAPVLFPQFATVNQLWNGFVAHTLFYGAVLGGVVAWAKRWRAPAAEVTPLEEKEERKAA